MPIRWPRQTVMKVLSARTPRSSGSPTRRLSEPVAATLGTDRPRGQEATAPARRLGAGVDNTSQPPLTGEWSRQRW